MPSKCTAQHSTPHVLGVMLTVANKLLSYDSPKDAFDDITGRF
jgi:hypothetical protein